MANEIRFYESTAELPTTVEEGAIYFILKEDNIAAIKVDLNGSRYTVNPEIPLATEESAGLLSPQDKQKLIPISVEKTDNSDVYINAENDFNFLQNIKIKNQRVLTESSFASVDVIPIGPDDPVQNNAIEIIETEDNQFIMKLWLNIPTGPQGEQGEQGPRGKASRIDEITATVDANIGEPEVEVISETTEEENDFVTNLNFDFKNLKGEQGEQGEVGPQGIQGPQGEIVNVKFKFIAGTPAEDGTELNSESIIEEDPITHELTKTYIVTVPRGLKGDAGKNLEVEYFFDSKSEMRQAVQNHQVTPNTYMMLQRTDTDPANGEIWYKGSNEPSQSPSATDAQLDIRLITDISPTQPVFSVERNVSIIPWNQQGEVTIDNTQGVDKPKLNFTIPRGKPMDFGISSATIDKKYGTPQITITPTNIDDGADTRQQNLAFNFKNMGVQIDSAEGTVDNTVGNPRVTITPSVYDNNTKQKLSFAFQGIKGEQGNVGPMPQLRQQVNLTVTPGDPGQDPTGSASWSDEDNQKVLNIFLTNVKGQDGNIANISYQGSGNAVSNLTYVNRNLTVVKDYQFATETYAANANNISSGTIKVANGGTGLNTIQQNAIMIGNGTSNIKTINSAKGALYSTGTNAEPQFNILPSSFGGTGREGLTINAVLVGDGNDPVKMIGTQSGALYATGSTYTPQFGTLPVAQGGTGSTSFTANALVVGNGIALKQISSSKGVLKSSGNNQEPTYGLIDVTDGGTGVNSFISNSVVIGKDSTTLGEVQSTEGAFYSTGTDVMPQFGTLPTNVGGTGATTAEQARINLGAAHASIEQDGIVSIPTVSGTDITYVTRDNFLFSFDNVVTPVEEEEENED